MRKFLRWLGYVLAAILIVALLFALWVWFASSRVLGRAHEASAETLAPPIPAQLADAGRQARILGCYTCHGEGLAGRMMFDARPFAMVWTTNLPELAGRTTDQQLAQAIRQGIGHDGRALYIMPSSLFSRLDDQEVAALIAHIRSLPRGSPAVPGIQWGPLGRFALATVMPSQIEQVEEFRVRQPFDVGPAYAAGRRLVAIQCGQCHAPDLSGGEPMPDVFSPGLDAVGAYSLEQFRALMRTGVAPHGRDLGMMREAALNDLRHYTDAEIGQIHAYLVARAGRVQDPPPGPRD